MPSTRAFVSERRCRIQAYFQALQLTHVYVWVCKEAGLGDDFFCSWFLMQTGV